MVAQTSEGALSRTSCGLHRSAWPAEFGNPSGGGAGRRFAWRGRPVAVMVTNKVSYQINPSHRLVWFDTTKTHQDDPLLLTRGMKETEQLSTAADHEWSGRGKGHSLVASLQVSRWRSHAHNIRGDGSPGDRHRHQLFVWTSPDAGNIVDIFGRGRREERSAGSALICSWVA